MKAITQGLEIMDKSNVTGRNMAAWGLIGIGILFLLAQTFSFSLMGTLWPLLVIVPGAVFLYAAYTGDRGKSGLAVPGAMITGTGLILFYQNLTNHWESWAYIWALYPVFLGLALTFIGRRTESAETYRVGNGFVKWGLVTFIGFWALFEILIFGSSNTLITTWLPLIFIGAGILMLFQRGTINLGGSKKKKTGQSSNGYHAADINPDLRRKIDEALADQDTPQPHSN